VHYYLRAIACGFLKARIMKADVAVVGAGALGLSTALHCGLRGRSVVVLDRRTPGSQASGRAAGVFKSVQGDEIRTFLARRSIDLVRTFACWSHAVPGTRSCWPPSWPSPFAGA
jgi:glycine/D-amino acid oxidase-like deaminating enzyme